MIFVDTGAFLARHLARDQHHVEALEGWRRLEKGRLKPVTSNFVLDEAVTLLGRWAGNDFAAKRARSWFHSELLEILRPGPGDELAAVELLERLADQDVSFTDCISFVLMRGHGIERAFTFDRHFRAAGFSIWPG